MSNYDGNQPSRWEHCPWQPVQIRNQLTQRKINALLQLRDDIMQGRRVPLTPEQRKQLYHRGYR